MNIYSRYIYIFKLSMQIQIHVITSSLYLAGLITDGQYINLTGSAEGMNGS